MKNLQRKAEEEEKQNRGKQRELLEKYSKGKMDEKIMLAELAAELEEKKRAAKNEEFDRREKGKREWEETQTKIKHAHEKEMNEVKVRREIEKEADRKNEEEEKGMQHVKNKISDEKRNFIAKNFSNPIEAIDYLNDPEKYEGQIEEHDNRGIIGKTLGLVAGIPFEHKTKFRIKQDGK
jgi:2-succinyl-5-enolpyruvyl-6-hydroxy-3-cyclohexene-1-carboxylate synthase